MCVCVLYHEYDFTNYNNNSSLQPSSRSHCYGKLTCHMGSHSVARHPAEVRFRLYPAEAGTRFSDPGGMQVRVDLRYVKADRLGFEPTTCQSQVQRPIPQRQHIRFRGHGVYITQDVALTGRNTTGPPRAASGKPTLHMRRVTDDDDRHRRPLLYSGPPTLCVGGPVIWTTRPILVSRWGDSSVKYISVCDICCSWVSSARVNVRSTSHSSLRLSRTKMVPSLVRFSRSIGQCHNQLVIGKGKGFPYPLPSERWTRNWSQCTSSQPAGDYIYSPPGARLPLIAARPAVTFPAADHHRSWPVPSYTAWWQRHICVNNLPKVVTQVLPRVGFESATCWSHVQRSTRCAT